MFDNPEKLFILFVIALLIFGPSKLATLGASLGRSIRDFRSAVRGAHDEFRQAVQEHVDTITPALPSPESMSLETPAAPDVDYGTAMSTPATPDAADVSAYPASVEAGAPAGDASTGPASAGAAASEDDAASLASEPSAAALKESLSH
ncbi:MAG TPA: twin-arginine translocase TatA/TatE family subunit [bacterium]|nr:twin-arginine translocase TatA/TatE family subunit [bacterium]